MGQRADFTDLDLLAYADGRLDATRAREVADYLESHPELARKLADFARQNREMHSRFDHYLDEPLPERLSAVIAGEAQPVQAGLLRRWAPQAAAACVLMALTGTAGWWVGTMDRPGDTAMARFLDQAAAVHAAEGGGTGPASVSGEQVTTRPMHWLSDKVSLELALPDMEPHGYELVDQRLVEFQDTQGIVLQYRAGDGERLNVFMKTRWDDGGQEYQFATAEGLSMAYWRQGPLAVAVASERGDRENLGQVAKAVHEALLEQRTPEHDGTAPKLMPGINEPGAAQEAGVSPRDGGVNQPAIGSGGAPSPSAVANDSM